jgi:hypothetical protein
MIPSDPITVLNTSAAEVTSGDAPWYNVKTAYKVIFFITITGTCDVIIEMDALGDGTKVVALGTYSATDEKVLDDPCGRIRVYTSGCGGGDTARVDMVKVYQEA